MIIEGLEFKCTCHGCPEQYDVFDGDKQVGYVRLRHGGLRCDYPNCEDGETIFSESFDDGWKGNFDDDNERNKYLILIAKAIKEKMKNA